MTDSQKTITTTLTVTHDHFPHILSPFTPRFTATQPGQDPSYSVLLPDAEFPDMQKATIRGIELPLVMTRAYNAPLIVPGDGGYADQDNWDSLVRLAARWKYPLDRLLWDREITVASVPWVRRRSPNNSTESNHLALRAVRIGGDLDEVPAALKDYIAERKAELGL